MRRKLGLPSRFDLRLGDPLAVARLALAFPQVPFIIPHFGAGLLREALMAADICPNIYLDTSSSNSWIRYTPGLTLEAVFASALAVAGPSRLLFGTDSSFFPRGWQHGIYERQRPALRRLGVGAERPGAHLRRQLRPTLSSTVQRDHRGIRHAAACVTVVPDRRGSCMKAIVVREFGGPDVLQLEDVPTRHPAPARC